MPDKAKEVGFVSQLMLTIVLLLHQRQASSLAAVKQLMAADARSPELMQLMATWLELSMTCVRAGMKPPTLAELMQASTGTKGFCSRGFFGNEDLQVPSRGKNGLALSESLYPPSRGKNGLALEDYQPTI